MLTLEISVSKYIHLDFGWMAVDLPDVSPTNFDDAREACVGKDALDLMNKMHLL
jgi:hypothetical protein